MLIIQGAGNNQLLAATTQLSQPVGSHNARTFHPKRAPETVQNLPVNSDKTLLGIKCRTVSDGLGSQGSKIAATLKRQRQVSRQGKPPAVSLKATGTQGAGQHSKESIRALSRHIFNQ